MKTKEIDFNRSNIIKWASPSIYPHIYSPTISTLHLYLSDITGSKSFEHARCSMLYHIKTLPFDKETVEFVNYALKRENGNFELIDEDILIMCYIMITTKHIENGFKIP
jgi:hypothetical protein